VEFNEKAEYVLSPPILVAGNIGSIKLSKVRKINFL